jgi:hypothetical protein
MTVHFIVYCYQILSAFIVVSYSSCLTVPLCGVLPAIICIVNCVPTHNVTVRMVCEWLILKCLGEIFVGLIEVISQCCLEWVNKVAECFCSCSRWPGQNSNGHHLNTSLEFCDTQTVLSSQYKMLCYFHAAHAHLGIASHLCPPILMDQVQIFLPSLPNPFLSFLLKTVSYFLLSSQLFALIILSFLVLLQCLREILIFSECCYSLTFLVWPF